MDGHADKVLWTAGFFNERFPEPVSPLGWSLHAPLVEEIALREPLRYLGYRNADRIPITRLWHGHPYTNVYVFQTLYKVFPDWLLPEDAYRYFPEGDVSLRKQASYPRSVLSPRFLRSILGAVLSDPENASPLHNFRKWARYTAEHDRHVAALQRRVDALEQSRAAPQDILAALQEANGIHRDFLRIHRWSLTHADLTFGLLKRLLRRWVDKDRAAQIASEWIAGVSNKTLEVDTALQELADQELPGPGVERALEHSRTWAEFEEAYRQQGGAEAEVFLGRLRDLVSKHGHRSFSLDIAAPTFADDPRLMLQLLDGMDRVGSGKSASRDSAMAGASTRNKEVPAALAHLSPLKRWPLGNVLRLARRYVGLREDQRYYWQKSLALSRRLYLLLAGILVEEGTLAQREDVFYATHGELEEHAACRLPSETLRERIQTRQAEWTGYRQKFRESPTESYPPFLQGDTPLVARRSGQQVWHARAISPGAARGVARVCKTAQELARVREGEILIAPATDPAWTPVFGRIAGLVLERGGVLSHSAVVAREYRVPAVAGISNIADEIRDGEMIEVDGNTGRVARVAGGATP